MLYLANLFSIILFTFAISFLVAEPWSKSTRIKSELNSKQTVSVGKKNLK